MLKKLFNKFVQYFNKALAIKEVAVQLCSAIESGADEKDLLEVSKKIENTEIIDGPMPPQCFT